MNKLILLLGVLLLFSIPTSYTQNIGIGTVTPEASAKLDISSSISGLLIPRVSLNDVTDGVAPVNLPATGLLVYNTNPLITGGSGVGFYYWDGSAWARMYDSIFNSGGGGGNDWRLIGNASTNPTNNFIGTTDATDFVFRTDNTERMRISDNGKVGIGTSDPNASFHVSSPGNAAGLGTMIGGGNNAFMELRGGTPYIDFSNGATGDYDIRLIRPSDDALTLQGGRLGIGTLTPTAGLHVYTPGLAATGLGVIINGGPSGNSGVELRGGIPLLISLMTLQKIMTFDSNLAQMTKLGYWVDILE